MMQGYFWSAGLHERNDIVLTCCLFVRGFGIARSNAYCLLSGSSVENDQH